MSETKKNIIFLATLIFTFLAAIISLKMLESAAESSPPKIAAIIVLVAIYLISGKPIFLNAFANAKKREFFDENVLMLVATLAAFAIGAYEEACAVMLFFRVGEFLQELALDNSKRSIKALLEIAPNIAHLKVDESISDIAPQGLKIGDIVLVRPGEKIPIDGVVLEGESLIDTKALTGEPIPKKVRKGAKILGGTLNLNGILEIETTKIYEDSSISKIIHLVQNATQNKAKTESFITQFARIYTPIVFFAALCIAILPPLFGLGAFGEWIYRALVVLMVSCPCALVISVPLAYFGGIGAASKKSILIKGANYLEALSSVTNIAFDKTGTLTKGEFKITRIVPSEGFSEEEVLQYAYCAENFSNHPIALAIKSAYKTRLKTHTCVTPTHKNLGGLGVQATCNYQNILAGNDKMLHFHNIPHECVEVAESIAHIAVDGVYAGYILIADELKEDTKEALDSLRILGVEKMLMLTGDNQAAAEKIANELNIEANGDLLPEEKAAIFERFSATARGKSVFVGDGINDAPSIAAADVGVSMGSLGSDLSKESADVLIVNDRISSLAVAIKIAKKTKQIIYQNIAFALGVKVLFIILGLFGAASMWEAVFGDVGVALLALGNSMRILHNRRDFGRGSSGKIGSEDCGEALVKN